MQQLLVINLGEVMIHMKKATLALTLASMALVGCGKQNVPTQAVGLNSAIVGGTKAESGELSSVVALLAKNGRLCTGVVVHPKLVLTAAHCVKGLAETDVIVYQGNELEKMTPDSIIPVEKVAAFPAYQDFHPFIRVQFFSEGHDIGYLVLSKELAVTPTPVLANEQELAKSLQAEATLLHAGFGVRYNPFRDEPDPKKIGEKFKLESKLQYLLNTELQTLNLEKMVAPGDSGGPVFVGTEAGKKVVAVASRIHGAGLQRFTRTDQYVCWVEQDSGIDITPEGSCHGNPDLLVDFAERRLKGNSSIEPERIANFLYIVGKANRNSAETIDSLVRRISETENDVVKSLILETLIQLRAPAEKITGHLSSMVISDFEDLQIRSLALAQKLDVKDPEILKAIEDKALKSSKGYIREAALITLASLRKEDVEMAAIALNYLREAKDVGDKIAGLHALLMVEILNQEISHTILGFLEDEHEVVADVAQETLQSLLQIDVEKRNREM